MNKDAYCYNVSYRTEFQELKVGSINVVTTSQIR